MGEAHDGTVKSIIADKYIIIVYEPQYNIMYYNKDTILSHTQ